MFNFLHSSSATGEKRQDAFPVRTPVGVGPGKGSGPGAYHRRTWEILQGQSQTLAIKHTIIFLLTKGTASNL